MNLLPGLRFNWIGTRVISSSTRGERIGSSQHGRAGVDHSIPGRFHSGQLRALKLTRQSEAVRFVLIWFQFLGALRSGIAQLASNASWHSGPQ